MEEFDIEKFPTSGAAKRMLGYVSEEFYEKSYVGKWLYQIMGLEWDDAGRILKEELPKQFFPETATWGLMFHEIKWGLPVRQNLSYEERRNLVFQKMNYRMPMNPYQMEQYVKGVTGADVCIADVNDSGIEDFKPEHPNVFGVFLSGDRALDLYAVMEILDEIKQSHTTYIIRVFQDARAEACAGMGMRQIYRPAAILDGETIVDAGK